MTGGTPSFDQNGFQKSGWRGKISPPISLFSADEDTAAVEQSVAFGYIEKVFPPSFRQRKM
jgi:hypothetical protein